MKKITMSIILTSITLIALAQSSVTVNITAPGGSCGCPTVGPVQLYVVDMSTCTGAWNTIPTPACGTPTTYLASSYCATCQIIAGRTVVCATPVTLGDNSTTVPACVPALPTFTSSTGGRCSATCQWSAAWVYDPMVGTAAEFDIN
jgi:hypothetical protein